MMIAHLSDPHLMAGAFAAEPAAGLTEVIDRMLSLIPRPDCVLITGDLANNGHPDEYAVLHAILRRCPMPVHLTTGNHDDRAAMLAEFGGTRFLGGGTATSYVVEYPDATIVVADSRLPDGDNGVAGRLGPDQVAWLDTALAARPDVPALVCLHHPPTPVGVPFFDSVRLRDGEALGAVIAAHPRVVRVLAGHVHRVISVPFAGSLVTTAPSTFRQVELRLVPTGRPTLMAEPSGFLLHLLSGTHCVTHVVPTASRPAPFRPSD